MDLTTTWQKYLWGVLFNGASRYIHKKKNQLDAQFIFSIFLQTPLHVSGISIAHHQEVHRIDATVGTIQPEQQTVT